MLTDDGNTPFICDMEANPYLPAIEAIKAQIAAKEEEIAPLRQQLAAKDAEINPLREMANGLCKLANQEPLYIIETGKSSVSPGTTPRLKFRPDQFFNKDLSEAAVEYLTAKKAADTSGDPTPATPDEIYSVLTAHGYTFAGASEANNKSALKTALTRNTSQVAKIKDDLYGLRAWYGMRARYKRTSDAGSQDAAGDAASAENKDATAPTEAEKK